MDRTTRDLEAQVANQQKQLARYETRLKDVVAAYKGLLKEKEALEASFSALSGNVTNKEKFKDSEPSGSDNEGAAAAGRAAAYSSDTSASSSQHGGEELNQQMATLMNSLATLSAEKSRMEASFQADKRQLRQDLAAKDKHIKELQDKAKAAVTANGLEVEKVKSKLIIERHARDKEINDHMAMVRELQKLLSDERHLKENLEMQLNDLKTQFTHFDTSDSRVADLRHELDQIKRKYKELKSTARAAIASSRSSDPNSNPNDGNNSNAIVQLQNEMSQMKLQHTKAIANEQKRAQHAEDRSKNLAAIHEERVVTLESRLTELSASVGTYDRLRQADQESIFRLKEKIALLESNSSSGFTPLHGSGDASINAKKDINQLVEEIIELKKILIIENAKQTNPRDLSKLFATGNDHAECIEDYEKLKKDFEAYRLESESLHKSVATQTNHIRTLQDKIQVLNRNIDEQEQELKLKSNTHYTELKSERAKWKELVASMEIDFRGKVSDLEIQLQKQRERSLNLLEEKEQEIKNLKASLELLIPGSIGVDDAQTGETKRKLSASQMSMVLAAGNHAGMSAKATTAVTNVGECHMLHYVHELSRKEVEITALRKAKNLAEASLRQALQDKVTTQQELHDRIGDLEDNVDRLERCKSRESANLEYLKNVVLSFLVATDTESKRHMVNAIGAVLEFNPAELKTIANYFAGRK